MCGTASHSLWGHSSENGCISNSENGNLNSSCQMPTGEDGHTGESAAGACPTGTKLPSSFSRHSRKLQMDTLVSVYVRYEEEIELVAIGALSESADKSGRYVQVNIEHRINDELLSKIMQNDRMKKRYFIEDTVRFSDISDLMK